MGASGLGTAGLVPRITFASAGGMLPFDIAPTTNPHPFSLTLSMGGLLQQTDECTADSSWQIQGRTRRPLRPGVYPILAQL